jgi:hypothetical protein
VQALNSRLRNENVQVLHTLCWLILVLKFASIFSLLHSRIIHPCKKYSAVSANSVTCDAWTTAINKKLWEEPIAYFSCHSIAVNCCRSSPAQSFLASGPVGTNDNIFVRSKTIYVFGDGASSWTTGWVGPSQYSYFPFTTEGWPLHGPSRKHRVQQVLYCFTCIRWRGNVFAKPLPSKFWLRYSGFQALCHIAASFKLLSNLRGCNICITDVRDLSSMPLRCAQVPWYIDRVS